MFAWLFYLIFELGIGGVGKKNFYDVYFICLLVGLKEDFCGLD